MNASVLLQRRELLRDHVQRERLRARLRADVVAVAHVDGPAVEFLLANDCTRTCTHAHAHTKRSNRMHKWAKEMKHTEDEVVLRNFAVADLLRERVLAVVHVDIEPELGELLGDLRGILPLDATSAICLPGQPHIMHSRREWQRGRPGPGEETTRTACITSISDEHKDQAVSLHTTCRRSAQ